MLVLGLAGCSSPEERAQAHYERAMAYLADGDTARAAVEFRNVFRLDDDHEAARLAYGAMLRDRGDAKGALGQYELAARQHPNILAAQRAAGELALELQDLETATQAADRAFALAPADPDVRALKASIDYRRERDRPAAVAMARAVAAEVPGNVEARVVLVADRLAAKDLAGARAEVEAGLAAAPDAEELHFARVALLEEAGDATALGDELARMAGLYPTDEGVRTALVQWHLRSGDPAAAEAVLRAAADAAGAPPGAALILAQFLLETKGAGAARAELRARVAAAGPDTATDGAAAGVVEAAGAYRRALAGLDYAEGDAAGGIAAMRALVAATPAASDAARDLKTGLARMLEGSPDPATRAEGEALIETVLAEDPTHLGALKLDARAAIDGDRAETAIRDMRTALTVAPRDPEVMTLTALAHERLGQRALMGEQLALAVEASNRGKDESLRYASFLMQENRPGPAEGVVADALRRAPDDPDLLQTLGRIELAQQDWDRAS
jgi:cellulose synthase operon protein C